MILRPFFSFYGSKWQAAKRYPAPTHPVVCEPFAGSAGYALRYPDRRVVLCDTDPTIVGVWEYLIHVSVSEILRLPLGVTDTRELKVCQEARWLIGMWLNRATTRPNFRPGAWARSGKYPTQFWGENIRERIARQVDSIRHWQIYEASYEIVPNARVTWFVDPPYSTRAGRAYRHHEVDYAHLAAWSREREGQVIVCEQEGASWLPFAPFGRVKSNNGGHGRGYSHEVVWCAS